MKYKYGCHPCLGLFFAALGIVLGIIVFYRGQYALMIPAAYLLLYGGWVWVAG